MLNAIDKHMLRTVAGMHDIPQGAYNIRKNGAGISRNTTANIEIRTKEDKPGIDIIVKPGTKGESVHIPVILTAEGLEDLVYNTFDIGEGADVLVVAGCGIHNPGDMNARHDGIHNFIVRKGARVRYVEKHYGEGTGQGQKILNPKTIVELEEDAFAEMELVQISGVDNTKRDTEARLHKNAHLLLTERMLTDGNQFAESKVQVELLGQDSSVRIISRSVGRDNSRQIFYPRVVGLNRCRGHVQCDSIIMHEAQISSIPAIAAHHADAQLIHEAAIGKIAGEQLIKLMSMGLSESEAEETILKGFLK
ncbi:MAG: FeS cluster assembly protein SufB [Pelotomaculum sp. PtaB.Bin013]|uniref:SufD family Fe-S cluster assembly protein n=1 Tax=Pelotomaculum isophthalicicum JI TaxID=947010 RepID=A0A9X4JW57_9FIRM|nr:SufD family Fe-S cluster assembly protein [Pelotomaculum isophthalicicum]MDF9408622.1 SufD family Fe-S cluster assembly protein [Pelotomaculum isophthalicicum JI]OPX82020.1 MAG: FeS cluster assembly protein SufB [Pelotomaculum sp. PtaB.Bin013]